MFMSARMAPRGQVTARNNPGRSPEVAQGWLAEAINDLVGPEDLEDTKDYRKHSGEVAR